MQPNNSYFREILLSNKLNDKTFFALKDDVNMDP